MTDTTTPGGAARLLETLAAVEAGIRPVRHRLPAAVVEEIARLWAAGATVPEAASRAGVSREIVRDRLHRAGALEYRFREQRQHVQEVFERRGAELVAAYRAGASLRALAAGAGVSSPTLQKYLISEGVTLRPGPGRARMVLSVRGAEIIAAYKAGTPFNVLAAETGITFRTLRRFLIGEGVALRHDRGRRKRTIRDEDSRG